MMKVDPVSGVAFNAFTPEMQSLEFVDVAPYVSASNPKTHAHPSVSVVWGRKVNCALGERLRPRRIPDGIRRCWMVRKDDRHNIGRRLPPTHQANGD